MFKINSIRTKIFVLLFICIFIPSVLLTLLTFIRFRTSVENNTVQSIVSGLEKSTSQIEQPLKSVVNICNSLASEKVITNLAKEKSIFNENQIIENYESVRSIFNYYLDRIREPNILRTLDSFYLYLPKQDLMMTSDSTYYKNIKQKLASSDDYLIKDNYFRWYSNYPVNFYTLDQKQNEKILITYKIPVKINNETEAVVYINVNKKIFENIISSEYLLYGESFFVSEKNSVIYENTEFGYENEIINKINAKNNKSNNSLKFKHDNDNAEKLVVYSQSTTLNYNYVVVVDSAKAFSQINEMLNYIILLIFISLILILVLTYFLSGSFYKPLDKVVIAMNEIEKRNLDYRITEQRKDEFLKVYTGYNNMASELKNLINDLSNEKILNKEAKIKLLQEQINPHFLYNTLDSVYSLIKINKTEQASQMIFSLSKFFRASLSGGRDIVELSEAVEIAESYLQIQKIRFGDRFNFSFNIPNDLEICFVPKLIIQPFIENALYHGLENVSHIGQITVEAEDKNNSLVLTVKDNGAGMTEEKLDQLRDSLKIGKQNEKENFAINNINMQIKLKYGENYGVSIESIQSVGTAIRIKIPIIKE